MRPRCLIGVLSTDNHLRGPCMIGTIMTSAPTVEVSWGELIDKITILEIKARRLSAPTALANVRRELTVLNMALKDAQASSELAVLKRELAAINESLWDIEDKIRAKEAAGAFDREFIELARSVYINNDKRASVKRAINELLKSELVEEKQYTPYKA